MQLAGWYARLASGLLGTQPMLSLTLGTGTASATRRRKLLVQKSELHVLLNKIKHKVEGSKHRIRDCSWDIWLLIDSLSLAYADDEQKRLQNMALSFNSQELFLITWKKQVIRISVWLLLLAVLWKGWIWDETTYCASHIFFQLRPILCFTGLPAGIQVSKRKQEHQIS